MSTTAITPGPTSYAVKSFWQRPEGKAGKYAVVILGLAAAGVGYALILPLLLGVVWGTIQLAIGVGALIGTYILVTNKTVKCLVRNVFQSVMRHIANIYTTTDPIGILKNNLEDMRDSKKQLDATVQRFAGSENRLLTKIKDKSDEILKLGAKSQTAEVMVARETDPDKKEHLILAKETAEQQAGMLMTGIEQLKTLETQTKSMLDSFRHYARVADANIDRTSMKVDFYEEQYKDIKDAQATLSVGQRLLRGDSEQEKLVMGAIDFLNDDAARTIGEIQEFNRYSDKLLTDVDLDNNTAAAQARQKFAEFGVKLDVAASKPLAVDQLQLAGEKSVTAVVTGRREMVASSDYNSMFKK